ncbi:MAG: ParB/RepB/Spo0J family partition protein [Deltaproteobacteria bacterium]|nr:ParB/RepB/Spo0J family partition protein [Deltaproteobacteria bacterium]
MRFDSTHLDPSSIDIGDDRYRITTALPDKSLGRSISLVGLLHPPVLQAVLQKTTASYIVVSGFNRIKAVSAMGWSKIDCFVLSGDTSPKDCLLFSIADNVSSRSLNLLEQANAVRKLSVFVPDKIFLCAMLEDIGLNLSPGLVSKYERLLKLPQELQAVVGRGLMPLAAALSLEGMDLHSVHMICGLIERLRPGTNLQKEILSRLKEFAAQKGIPVSSVLELPDVSGILNSGEADRKAMLQHLRKALRRLCFPSLCAMEDQFAESLSRLELPPGVRFVFPEGFEDTRYRLELEIKSASDMENHGCLMQEISSHPALLEIFKRELRD